MKPYEGKHETLKVVLKVLPCHLTSHLHVVERLHVHSLGSKIHGQAVDVSGRPFTVSSVHGPQHRLLDLPRKDDDLILWGNMS